MHKKYTYKDGKRFGPYYYETKRVNGRVVTTYLGQHNPKHSFFISHWFLVLFSFLLFFTAITSVQFGITSYVSFDIKPEYNIGEVIDGKLNLNLIEGEIIPADTRVVAAYNGVFKEFTLSDLVSEPLSEGQFYAESVSLSGEGFGFGRAGKIKEYPFVEFKIALEEDESKNSDFSGKSDDVSPVSEEDSQVVEENSSEIPENAPETETPPSEIQSSESETESAPEPFEENTESVQSESEQSESASITGSAVSDFNSNVISGKASKDTPFIYELSDGQTASIIEGSVFYDGTSLSDDILDIKIKKGEVIVSTNYFVEKEGFGPDFIGNKKKKIEIGLSSFGFVALNDSEISIVLDYNGVKLAEISDNILVSDSNNSEYSEPEVNDSESVFAANESVVAINDSVLANITSLNETLGNLTEINQTVSLNITNATGIIINESVASVNLTQFTAVIGQSVRWVKRVAFDVNDTINLVVQVPISADNITLNKIDLNEYAEIESLSEEEIASLRSTMQTEISAPANNSEISEENFSITITGGAVINSEFDDSSVLSRFFSRIFKLTGNVVEENIVQEVQEVSILLNENDFGVEVGYYTDAPTATEEISDETFKTIKVSSPADVHYENVLIFTNLSDNLRLTSSSDVRIEWVENDSLKLDIYSMNDSNGDGYYDYVSWIAPHLSNQTFNIIVIIDAQHLNETRGFISNIYNETRELDGIWSETIPGGHYVRVRFERNLTSDKDISIYPRIVSGNPVINVYEVDGSDVIASFNNIAENEYNKVYLTNLTSESQDTFDLRVIGGGLQFDHVVDPSTNYLISNDAEPVATAATSVAVVNGGRNIIRLDSGRLIAFWEDDTDDQACAQSNNNGSSWTVTNPLATTTVDEAIATNGSSIIYVLVGMTGAGDVSYLLNHSNSCGQMGGYADVGNMLANFAPDVAFDGFNNRFVVCSVDSFAGIDYAYSTVGATLSFTSASITESDVTSSSCSIDVDDNGNVFIAEHDNTNVAVRVHNSSAGTFASYTTRTVYGAVVTNMHMSIRGTKILITAQDTRDDLVLIWSNDGETYDNATLTGTFSDPEGCIDENGNFHTVFVNGSAINYVRYSDGAFEELEVLNTLGTEAYPSVRCSNFPSNNRLGSSILEFVYTDTGTNIYFANVTIDTSAPVGNIPPGIFNLTSPVNGSGTTATSVNISFFINDSDLSNGGNANLSLVYIDNEVPFTNEHLAYRTTDFPTFNGNIYFNYSIPPLEYSTNSGMILLYHFDNNTHYGENFTYVVDFATYKFNSSITSPAQPMIQSINGLGLAYKGNHSQRISLADNALLNSPSTTDELTIMFWFNLSTNVSDDNGFPRFLGKDGGSTQTRDYSIVFFNSTKTIEFSLGNGTASTSLSTTAKFPSNISWYHYAATFVKSTGNATIYIDGLPHRSTIWSNPNLLYDSTGSLNIGGTGGTNYIRGLLDDVAIYNRTLNSSEILDIYRLKEGAYYVRANVTDAAGGTNSTNSSSIYTFFVDRTAPSSLTLNDPANNSYFSSGTTISFNWTAVDAIDSSMNCNLSLDNVINQSNIASANNTMVNRSISGLSVATHYWNVTCLDDAGNNVDSVIRTLTINGAPYNGTVLVINSTLGLNRTREDINVRTTLLDQNGNGMNVTVRWYNNSILHKAFEYNSSYSNGTTFTATLGYGNTTKGQNWSAGLTLNDGIISFNVNSSNITILNSLPNVTLISPANGSVTLNRTDQAFTWVISDDDGDSITDNRMNFTLVAASVCTDSNYNGATTYIIEQLNSANLLADIGLPFRCLVDNQDYYRWSVQASDAISNYGSFSAPFNISVQALLSTSMNISAVEFGNIAYLQSNDTTDNFPNPLIIVNNGNALNDIAIYASNLWNNVANPSTYYQFKIANVTTNGISENGSFLWGSSQTTYANVPLVEGTKYIVDLNYTDATDSAEIDINITVPAAEGPGYRNSTITFTVYLGTGDTYEVFG